MEKTAKPGMGIIGPVRLSYLSVFKPRANNLRGGKLEYSAVLLIPKADSEFCPNAKGVLQQTAELVKAALSEKFGPSVPKWENPVKDGDDETDSEGNPKYPGYWFVSVRCDEEFPPVLIDGNRKQVFSGWQSGDWGMVKVSFYGYEFERKKGVGAGLRAIQFLKHDEPLGSSNDPSIVANEFDEVSGADTNEAAYDPFSDEA